MGKNRKKRSGKKKEKGGGRIDCRWENIKKRRFREKTKKEKIAQKTA